MKSVLSSRVEKIAKAVAANVMRRQAATGNFSINKRCVVIPDELFEYGDGNEIAEEAKEIKGMFWQVEVKPGHYEAASIDIEENGEGDGLVEEVLGAVERTWFKTRADAKAEFGKYFDLDFGQGYLGKGLDAAWKVVSDYVDDARGFDDETLDSFYGLPEDMGEARKGVVFDFSADAYKRVKEVLADMEYDEIDKKVDDLVDKHGLTEYGVSERFSNGETWYSPIRYPKRK